MRVLGLGFTSHGSAACLVEDGHVVAAVNLERLTRVKFALVTLPDYRVLVKSIRANTFGPNDNAPIANFYDVFPQLLEAVTGHRRIQDARIDLVVKTKDLIRPVRNNTGPFEEFVEYFDGVPIAFDVEHHLCHSYQAYLCSPFEDAAILTVDGLGERLERLGNQALSLTHADGRGNRVEVLTEVQHPSSIGEMYSDVTLHLGFGAEQEGNTMALAAFGTDTYHRTAREGAYELHDDGSFTLCPNESGDGLLHQDRMRAFTPKRERGTEFTQDQFDLAWAYQQFAEEILVHTASKLQEKTGQTRLAMAGGVALNCVANSEILKRTAFEDLYIMPNAGDRGLAAGCALYGYHVLLEGTERHPLRHDFLGPPNTDEQIVAALEKAEGIEHHRSDDIAAECARLVADGAIIGWVQGGAEFGPRALGHRSLIADPRSAETKKRLDTEVKRREWFRPYAPSALADHADEYFDMLGVDSPYMLLAVDTRPEVRDEVPAIVHVDGSARVQTVEQDVDPLYHRLISQFYELTGIPLVVDTSFNGYGEPMVETAEDAIAAMHQMGLDALAVGDHLIRPR
ncbi:MAG: carbamoyl transferase [Acidimicrobiia bacterium]|nr:carbamoyl transferase [Acidimicrobiia bacterium]